MNKKVIFRDLGLTRYADTWKLQTELFEATVSRKLQNRSQGTALPTEKHLLFTEHFPVYTLGRRGDVGNLLVTEEFLKKSGADFFRTDRGGDITFHGPGQIVGYPILDLDHFFSDIHLYVYRLEETVIRALDDFGVTAGRIKGRSGVWVSFEKPDARKICAVGVRTSRWVTMHGFALNVNTDLDYFKNIVPCGIAGSGVTSLAAEKGSAIDLQSVKTLLLNHFFEIFEGYPHNAR